MRSASAQGDWPKAPIRWVVAFAAGGAADSVARNLSVRLSEKLGQQVIIENRTGGNAVVAANAALQSPRDGYTFLVDAANQITNPYLIKDVPFDYEATWLPVTQLSIFPQVVAVKHDFPVKTIQEYIAMAKAKPGTVSYCTPPAAGMGDLAGEALQSQAGIKLIHVPYRGGADARREWPAGFRDERLERPVCRCRHAGASDRPHAGSRRRSLQGRESEGAARSLRRRAGREHGRRIRRLDQGTADSAGQAHQRGRYQAQLRLD